ncbi:MAG: double-strand break repair helicase AddA [Silicimonas sp.]|nr:double-strand break repair helicase AddA [Silicimonas sp.]
MTNDATRAQNSASQPGQSTWLTANAGSGKTRVLTDRVARLLLKGTQPQNILCLTYTKAAASEMQNRLFKTLGKWAMLNDTDLTKALENLDDTPHGNLEKARTLFASAIEAPGGLKIQTIHSFCSKVLRQFPLEAGVNPRFRELDDPGQSEIIDDALRHLARSQPAMLETMRRNYTGDTLADLAKDVAGKADLFTTRRTPDEIYRAFGLEPGLTLDDIATAALPDQDLAFLKSLAPIFATSEGVTDSKLAKVFPSLPNQASPDTLLTLEEALLTQTGTIRTRMPTKAVATNPAYVPLSPQFVSICQTIEAAREKRLALEAAIQTVAIDAFAHHFLPLYTRLKSAAGALDFDDLIRKTRTLLSDRSLQWVLFRLDERIEHVLVDEAQDTSPAQWDVIQALVSEIVAGDAERNRTFFVVGDKKQSIYSFQGADAAGFDLRGEAFRTQMDAAKGMAKRELLHSFRSSPAVLKLVDTVFAEDPAFGDPLEHRAFYPDMPGRIDVWPLLENDSDDDMPAWYDPGPRTVATDGPVQLAHKLAKTIAQMCETGTIQGENGTWRRIRADDIMILVQRRSALFDNIISACKSRNLPMAGADRLKVGSELAVRDILALLAFLALPDDDLSLAAALRSPLFGWSERQLYDLASARPEKSRLWQALRNRRADYPETHATLEALRAQVDFKRPFELIETILTQHNGRRNLIRRLGPEAEDGIDELLNQALVYETTHVPSLTGFLAAARASEIEVKREAESGGVIRVMTVHGAKGLESPIVILPDTTFSNPRARPDILAAPGNLPVLPRSSAICPPLVAEAKAAKSAAEQAERDRLLYVALTRAEKWLIVCGVKPKKENKNRLNWHQKIEAAAQSLGATRHGEGIRFQAGDWKDTPDESEIGTKSAEIEPVSIAPGTPSPVSRPEVLSPSDLGGEKAIPGEPDKASGGFRKGRQLHLLLEHLPGATDPEATARYWLGQGPDAATEGEIPGLIAEAMSVITNHPQVFASTALAEVAITAHLPSIGKRISGAIDRLVIDGTSVLAVDFKSNAITPDTPEATPEGILRQMGAYLEALETLYPGKEIDVAILWTTTGALMPLPHGMVRQALQRHTTS